MTWLSITIFTTVVSVLLAFANSKDGKNVSISLFGILLTNVAVWFTAGFRWFRRHLALQVNDPDLAALLTGISKDRPAPMWRVFVGTFLLLNSLWVETLMEALCARGFFCHTAAKWSVFTVIMIAVAVFLWHAYRVGRTLTHQEWLEAHKEEPSEKESGSILEIASAATKEVPEDEWRRVPDDLSINVDHYLYGSKKTEK